MHKTRGNQLDRTMTMYTDILAMPHLTVEANGLPSPIRKYATMMFYSPFSRYSHVPTPLSFGCNQSLRKRTRGQACINKLRRTFHGHILFSYACTCCHILIKTQVSTPKGLITKSTQTAVYASIVLY